LGRKAPVWRSATQLARKKPLPRISGLANQIRLRSPHIDPYRVAPSGAASPDSDLVPASGICAEPGVVVAGIPVSPILPLLVPVGISLVRPDPLILVAFYDGVRPLAVPQGCGTIGPPSAVVDPLLKPAIAVVSSIVRLGPTIISSVVLLAPSVIVGKGARTSGRSQRRG
jgi:hypothetical protein